MTTVLFQGLPCNLYGEMPKTGFDAPSFNLTGKDLNDIKLEDYKGKKLVLNIFPSLDTPVCAASVRRFNVEASKLENTAVLCVSMDLPFAMGRFCTTEGIENVAVASAFRSPEFGEEYGLMIENGPLRGLLARCVIVIDEEGKIKYVDLVDEITEEPDYEEVLKQLK